MSRPLHRGVSGGGRLSVNGPDFWDDSQMKDKIEKEDLERNRSPGDQTYSPTKFLCRILFPDNSPSKHNLGENGLLSDPFSPGTGRNRLKYALVLIRLSLVVIILLALTGSFWWTISITSSSRGHIYHGYRQLQEQVVSDLRDIGQLSLGATNVKDIEYCPPESENFIPCFNVSENLDLGLSKGEEVDRHCGPGSRQNCLVLPPVNYKIPLRWPTGRDVIWHANVNITAQEVLSSGSMTKRLMMLEEEQISFRSDSAMFDSIEDYSHQIAEMIGLRNESNFVRADMVAFSSSYSTNGLTSPSGASFCSPFDALGSGHQAVGYVIPGSEITSKVLQSSSSADLVTVENASGSLSSLPAEVEAKSVDSLAYPILRPIVIPSMSRERSRSDFKRSHDHKSPCVPPSRREQPRIKRPPSPVVLCVPRAPHPPPPSPVGDSRRHRGFPTVRSGSSSPRQWGVKGWFHDGINFEEACIRMDGSEVVWPAWRSKSLSAHQLTQPLPGALLQDRLIAISQLTRDQEHPDVAFPLQPPETLNSTAKKACLSMIHSRLHNEIENFCKQVASENLIRKPYINWAVKRVARSLQVLWPRSRTNIFGSNATGLSLPSSDVDLVVSLPPVRNLEPIKEAGILEGRNGIKETCLQHAARYLANQEWVKNDSLKIVENTAIPIIMLVVEVPHDLISSSLSNLQTPKAEPTELTVEEGNTFQADSTCSDSSSSPQWSKMNECVKDVKAVRLDISFKSPSHTGLQTTELVKELTEQFPATTPLALVLKQFLADRSLDQSYSGGLSSYCLVLLITRFLQHEHHHSRPIDQTWGAS